MNTTIKCPRKGDIITVDVFSSKQGWIVWSGIVERVLRPYISHCYKTIKKYYQIEAHIPSAMHGVAFPRIILASPNGGYRIIPFNLKSSYVCNWRIQKKGGK
jgi:hypothetical protein